MSGQIWRPGYPPVRIGSEDDLRQQLEIAEREVERLRALLSKEATNA